MPHQIHISSGGHMILVRDVLQLKFGKAKDAKALAKEGTAIEAKLGMGLLA